MHFSRKRNLKKSKFTGSCEKKLSQQNFFKFAVEVGIELHFKNLNSL